MKRLLVASDDVHTRAWIAHSLEALDVLVSQVTLGDLAEALAQGETNLAVVDGGRSPEALVQLAEHAAGTGMDLKLLMLVERDALGAMRLPVSMPSDFMVRGGSSEELAARVRTLAWPGEEASAQELVRIDDLTLNLATYQAYIDSTPIDFTYLEYALFSFLVTHPNRAYSREMLLRRVWGTDYYGGSRTVDVHVRRVRAKLGAELSRRLETVRNVGYLWHG